MNPPAATYIAVGAGVAEIGDASRVAGLDAAAVAWAVARFREMVEESVDRMKADARPLPLLAVGGGAFLVLERVPGISEVLHVSHAEGVGRRGSWAHPRGSRTITSAHAGWRGTEDGRSMLRGH